MTDLHKEFLSQSRAGLDRLDEELPKLEDRCARKRLTGILRATQTIKGTSGFLGFTRLESVADAGLRLLAQLRKGALTATPEIASALRRMRDSFRQSLKRIESGGDEAHSESDDLAAELDRLCEPPRKSRPDTSLE